MIASIIAVFIIAVLVVCALCAASNALTNPMGASAVPNAVMFFVFIGGAFLMAKAAGL